MANAGEEKRALYGRLGIAGDQVPTPTMRVASGRVFALWEHATKVVPSAAVSARVAASTTRASTHLLGVIAETAPTLRAAIDATVQRGALHTDSGSWNLSESDRTFTLRWRRPGVLTIGHRLCNEAALCHWLQGLRRATGIALAPTRVWMRHEPSSRRELSDFFGCHIETGAGDEGFAFAREALDTVPVRADEMLWRVLLETADRYLARVPAPSLEEHVRAELAAELEQGEDARVSSRGIARRLAMSERTLRRKLAAHGVSYRALLESVRRELAMSLLDDPGQSITNIAFRTGYSDLSAFSHAHRRWHGVPPRARRGKS